MAKFNNAEKAAAKISPASAYSGGIAEMDEAPEGLANGDELLIALDYQF